MNTVGQVVSLPANRSFLLQDINMQLRIVVLGLCFFCSLTAVVLAASAAPPAGKTDAADDFKRVCAEWKDVLSQLATLKIEYRTADAQKQAEIQRKWGPLMDQATALKDKVMAAARQAYAAAPNADRQITELLVTLVEQCVAHDDYEPAYETAKLLMSHGCTDPRLPSLAGIAAFSMNDYDAAEAYFKQGAEHRTLSEPARKLMPQVDYERQSWAKEQQIRKAEAKANDLPRVLLKTNRGDIELELFENEAPNSTANFLTLADKGFYNGLTFHRVLPGFMAQGGCPKGDGTGGPGYNIPEEFTTPKHRLHFRGSVAMARSQHPDSAGSQFYLMFAPNGSLDGNYTVFGRVVKGFDVLAKIQRRDPSSRDEQADPDKIVEAKVLRKRAHAYTVKQAAE
jgi:cyclophilin family peptidyl-prolyl cis-trans isomerase